MAQKKINDLFHITKEHESLYKDFVWTEQNLDKIIENRIWARPDDFNLSEIKPKENPEIKIREFHVKKK